MAFTFGASSTPSLFGAGASTPASSPSLFGTTPLFGSTGSSNLFGASSSNPFGAASMPAFGSSQPASGAGFSFSNTGSGLFGASSAPALGQSQGGFGFGQQGFLQSNQQPAPAGVLSTVDSKQLTHFSKWEEINPQGQQQLLELEKIVSQTKEESRQLESCARLQDSGPEEPAAAEISLRHSLQGFSSACISQSEAVSALNERVHEVLHDTETAIRTFERSYRWREAAKAGAGQVLPPSLRELLSAPVVLPSQFLRKAVSKFQETMSQFQLMVSELEKLLPAKNQQRRGATWESSDLLRDLPLALSNTHDLLYHVAARIDALNGQIEVLKRAHVEARRRAGDLHDPFKEAHRREQHREQAAREKITIIPPAHLQSTAPIQAGPAPAAAAAGGSAIFGAPAAAAFGSTTPGGAGLFAPATGNAFGNFGGQDTSSRSTSRSRKAKK